MYYEQFEKLLAQRGVKPAEVARATGIQTATLTQWKKGAYTPKADKLQKIADYFKVPLEYLTTGEMTEGYYLNEEAAKMAQRIFEDSHLRALFDATQGQTPENLDMAAEMLRRFKATNPGG